MKRYLRFYDNTKTYIYPSMAQATPQSVLEGYPVVAIPGFVCVIETDASETMFYTAPEPIQVIRSRYNIDESLSNEVAIAAIEEIMNYVPEVEPTAEERIASALEYQNLLSM